MKKEEGCFCVGASLKLPQGHPQCQSQFKRIIRKLSLILDGGIPITPSDDLFSNKSETGDRIFESESKSIGVHQKYLCRFICCKVSYSSNFLPGIRLKNAVFEIRLPFQVFDSFFKLNRN
ncbi:hypothetical protein CDAR_529681 [Caerostris darwini]|uniref:Uncharacterized protein n=1 Tax=Caerostris darwini TaxID=1538125 RepID=A0AAV4S8N8_9ARAC|nr:hypothetical protein CDAR_529681 [Caerostris darwini]